MIRKHAGITTKATAIIIAVVIILVAVASGLYLSQSSQMQTTTTSRPTLTTTSASSTVPTSATTSQAGPSFGGTIKVGFSISLHGTYNVEGTASLNGIQTMAQWINDNGGVTVQGKKYNISLDYLDDNSNTANIVPLYTKLVQQDGAQFLLAPYSSGLTAAGAPIADQLDRVMLSHGGAADSIWAQGYKNLVEVLSPASYYLRVSVDWLKANHPTDKLAFVYAGDAFSAYAAQAAINYSKSIGFSVVYAQSYPVNVNDLTPILTAAKNAGADDLLGGGHFDDGLLVVKQLQSVGWKPKFISLLVAVTEPSFQTQLGNAANGVTGPSQWEKVVQYTPEIAKSEGLEWFGPTSQQFTNLYMKISNGKSPTYHSGEAGSSLLVLVDAIQKANSLSTGPVRQALAQMKIMNFFGLFQVDSTGKQSAHSMVLVQWQNGVLKVVSPKEIAESQVIYPYGS